MVHGGTSAQGELRRTGLRVTQPRKAVLEWLAEHPHATAEQIGNGVRDRLGSVSVQTVYDVLNACADKGLVRWIEPAGHPTRYERRIGDNHHHMVCRACGRIDDVDCPVGTVPCLSPEDDHGYQLEEAEVVFWGLCRDCSPAPVGSTREGAVPTDSHHHEEVAR